MRVANVSYRLAAFTASTAANTARRELTRQNCGATASIRSAAKDDGTARRVGACAALRPAGDVLPLYDAPPAQQTHQEQNEREDEQQREHGADGINPQEHKHP